MVERSYLLFFAATGIRHFKKMFMITIIRPLLFAGLFILPVLSFGQSSIDDKPVGTVKANPVKPTSQPADMNSSVNTVSPVPVKIKPVDTRGTSVSELPATRTVQAENQVVSVNNQPVQPAPAAKPLLAAPVSSTDESASKVSVSPVVQSVGKSSSGVKMDQAKPAPTDEVKPSVLPVPARLPVIPMQGVEKTKGKE